MKRRNHNNGNEIDKHKKNQKRSFSSLEWAFYPTAKKPKINIDEKTQSTNIENFSFIKKHKLLLNGFLRKIKPNYYINIPGPIENLIDKYRADFFLDLVYLLNYFEKDINTVDVSKRLMAFKSVEKLLKIRFLKEISIYCDKHDYSGNGFWKLKRIISFNKKEVKIKIYPDYFLNENVDETLIKKYKFNDNTKYESSTTLYYCGGFTNIKLEDSLMNIYLSHYRNKFKRYCNKNHIVSRNQTIYEYLSYFTFSFDSINETKDFLKLLKIALNLRFIDFIRIYYFQSIVLDDYIEEVSSLYICSPRAYGYIIEVTSNEVIFVSEYYGEWDKCQVNIEAIISIDIGEKSGIYQKIV